MRSFGADRVIDYTKEDFTKNGLKYDLILATAGYNSIFKYKRTLNPNGSYVMIGGSMKGPHAMMQIAQGMLLGPLISTGGKKLGGLSAKASQPDLVFIKELIEKGEIKAVIDRCYSLEDMVEAHRYVDAGHKKGNVVITVE